VLSVMKSCRFSCACQEFLPLERLVRRMSKKQNLYVVPHNDGWAVRREGASRVSSTHSTQSDAIDRARERGIDNGNTSVRIQGTNGRFREERTYGPDHCPPEG